MQGPRPLKIYNSHHSFIFTNNKKSISSNKLSKILRVEESIFNGNESKEYEVYSVLGLIEAKKKNYVVCASQVTFVGKYLNAKVFKINKFCYIPDKEGEKDLEDEPFLKMLDDFLERNPLYYSDKIDLTISLLNMKSQINAEPKSQIFKYTINQYCWNYSMAKCFDYEGMDNFVYPVINGFFGEIAISDISVDNNLNFILIGRKDNRRSGMRFLIRGADSKGKVANSVETEEILTYKDNEECINICSFIQIRGSIPIIWTQEPNMQLNPKIKPRDDFNSNCEVFKNHIEELFKNYGTICCVNLIDQKKDQQIIGEYYNRIVQNYKDGNKDKENLLKFVWFDFHKECKKMRYDKIKILFKTNAFHECIDSFGYNHIKYKIEKYEEINQERKVTDILINNQILEVIQVQKGTFRNNCIDSLDRTNVVQSVIGRYFLLLILSKIGFSDVSPSTEDVFRKFQGTFEQNFKTLWADHGDGISLAYSGTGALKSDFVRTGKRTLMGNIKDGYLSCKRFYLNNFRDGYNQDCHDYFLGTLTAKGKMKVHSPYSMQIFFSILLFLSYFISSVLKRLSLPKNYESSMKKSLFQLILFAGSFMLSFLLLNNYGKRMFIDYQSRHD